MLEAQMSSKKSCGVKSLDYGGTSASTLDTALEPGVGLGHTDKLEIPRGARLDDHERFA